MKFAIAVLAVLVVCAANTAHAKGQADNEFPRCFLDLLRGDNYYTPKFSLGGAVGSGLGTDSDATWTQGKAAYGGRGFATYDLTPCLSVEAAFGYWGVGRDSEYQDRYLSSAQLGLIARYYFNDRFAVFGRGGGHRWSMDYGNHARTLVVFDRSNGISPFYGIGAEAILGSNQNWRLGLSATRYQTPYRATIYRYNDAANAYNPGVAEHESHTNVIELSTTWIWKGKQ